ncbi:MAG: AIR synthase family protein [Tissierellaceae bacterium]|nr:AIR synthase family protein [Tissierellaceae bacterium]
MVTGKLPNDLLEKIVLKYITHKRDDIITGAAVGEDNALVNFGDEVAILSTDPITGAVKDIGKLAVHISCNDVSTSGGTPVGLLLTILAPPETTYEDIEKIMKDAGETAKELDVEIMGGHTEITDAVNKVVITTTVIGKIKKEKLQKSGNINVGDKILISKTTAIEGTSILLNDLESYFADKMDADKIKEGQEYGRFLSVLEEGKIGGKVGLNYMHDITEGGVLGAVWEAQRAIKKGVKIYKDQIPITDITIELCNILDINPLRLISSGSMLMIANDEQVKLLEKEYKEKNIQLTVIGEVVEEGIHMEEDAKVVNIEAPKADELYRALGKFNGI